MDQSMDQSLEDLQNPYWMYDGIYDIYETKNDSCLIKSDSFLFKIDSI